MARAAAEVRTSMRPRRSTTTISLPRPFIFRNGTGVDMRPYMARAHGKTIYAARDSVSAKKLPAASSTGNATGMSRTSPKAEAWLAVRRDHDGNLDILRTPDGGFAWELT